MIDPNMELLSTVIAAAATRVTEDPADAAAWAEARDARAATGDDDPELAAALEAEDADALAALVAAWMSGERHLPVPDRAVLKRAMKAFRKSLKVTLLDAESKLGGSAMTNGTQSDIVGIVPPARYPKAVWDELVRQGRLVADRWGTYELPPGG